MTPRAIATAWGDFQCYPDDVIGDALAEGRFWDAHLRRLMDRGVARGPYGSYGTAVDIGAYIGFHTCYLAYHYSHVVAFEPVLKTVELLRANLQANQVAQKVRVVPVGAYDRPVILRRALESETGWDPTLTRHAPSVPWFPGAGTDEIISAGPVDDFLNPHNPVRFIKIDAQGCDYKALLGLERTICRHRPLIVLEWEQGYAEQHGTYWPQVEIWAVEHSYALDRITLDAWDYVLTPEGGIGGSVV